MLPKLSLLAQNRLLDSVKDKYVKKYLFNLDKYFNVNLIKTFIQTLT